MTKAREFTEELARKNSSDPHSDRDSDHDSNHHSSGIYDGLRRIADGFPDIATSPLIVLVDQLEEIYTLCEDTAERTAFIENLLHAAGDRTQRVSVIATLRSDFLGQTQQSPPLNRLFSTQGFLVPAMSPAELRAAIK